MLQKKKVIESEDITIETTAKFNKERTRLKKK